MKLELLNRKQVLDQMLYLETIETPFIGCVLRSTSAFESKRHDGIIGSSPCCRIDWITAVILQV